jgi:alkylation response protein AidB-like acyl-CoA dehydrogenase
MPRQPLTFEETDDVRAVRSRIRELIRDELPSDFRGAFVPGGAGQEAATAFCKTLATEHLLTLAWPRKHGGGDGSIWEQTALREEYWAHHEPRGAQYMGVNWVGPAIMHFGTERQQEQHLSAIAAGDAVWCQGFSEPDAGSDLAALQLSAHTDDGKTFVANGQKVWTSYAGLANWCFLTARTARTDDKRHGITVFLVPMDRPGITVRPIDSILGPHHLNELFFDDVVLDAGEILGELHHGWDVVRLVLRFERQGIARYARSDRILADLYTQVASADGPDGDFLRAEHARALVGARIARLMSYRVVASGDVLPSISRIAVTELDQRVAELAMAVHGPDGLDGHERLPGGESPEEAWRYARSSTIASGTTEIQRMLVARQMVKEV